METKDLKAALMSARVTTADKEKYQKLAQEENITEADLVRRALHYYWYSGEQEKIYHPGR